MLVKKTVFILNTKTGISEAVSAINRDALAKY